MSHTRVRLCIVPLLLVLSLVGVPPTWAQGRRGTEGARPEQRDRTTPLLAAMTASQRVHSELFLHITHTRLLDTLESVDSRVTGMTPGVAPSLDEFLTAPVCSSGAFVVGEISSSHSFPTADGTFLFTEYDFVVSRLLYAGGPAASLRPNQHILVVRPGGRLVVDGVDVHASRGSSPLLLNGIQYALALDYLPSTGAYRGDIDDGTYVFDGRALKSLRAVALARGDISTAGVPIDDFGTTVRRVAPTCHHN